jgi:hypothetical protein
MSIPNFIKIYPVVGFKRLDRQEELPLLWKEFIIAPIYKEGNNTDCSNYTIFYIKKYSYLQN